MPDRKQYEVTTTYRIKYTTKNPVPISEIVSSLLSVEKLIKRTGPLVEAKYQGVEVHDIQVFVEAVETGSLKEWLVVRLICGSKENAEEAEKLLEKMVKDSGPLKILIALGVGAMVAYGVTKCNPNATHTSEFTNNTIINIGAEMDISVGDVRAILDATPHHKRLARESVDFVRPAMSDPDAEIENIDVPNATIPANVIAEAPETYEPPEQDERETQYSNAPIVIHASDRDKRAQVWAGIVPGIVDHRIRFILEDNVDPARLHGQTRVNADITVVQRFNKETNAFEAARVHLRAVN
jgi:hypothetical protein